VPIYDNIKTLTRESIASIESSGLRIDLLTGGFPCQPFSAAGKRKGKDDDRYLWPEMLRVIKEVQPRWIIGENVNGITNMAQPDNDADMEGAGNNDGSDNGQLSATGIVWGIIDNLEQIGYSVQAFVIPACAVGAPHRRDRIWFVANADSKGLERGKRTRKRSKHNTGESKQWKQNWFEVATRLCGVDDGFPAGVDGFKLSKAGHRIQRLKALGNAIVPQVVMEIMKVEEVSNVSR
jgi:DNA (cytosine-5)-methyltransferase 1